MRKIAQYVIQPTRELFVLTKYAVILSICSQLQRFLPKKMFRTKGILLVTTFLCFPGVTSAICPRSRYSDLNDTLQSPGNSTGNYPKNQNCTYDVRVPAGKRIIRAFDFKRFDIVGSISARLSSGFSGNNCRVSITSRL